MRREGSRLYTVLADYFVTSIRYHETGSGLASRLNGAVKPVTAQFARD